MTNTFRNTYRKLTDDEQHLVNTIKDKAEAMEAIIEDMPLGRSRSLAMTKLEEAVMWAVKGITG